MEVNGWKLVTEGGLQCKIGDTVRFVSDDETATLEGGMPPHRPGSSGKIYVTERHDVNMQREYYPSVCGLKWVKL